MNEDVVLQKNTYVMSCDEGVEPLLTDAQTQAICDYVLRDQGVCRPCIVSISIVTEAHIHEVNLTYRGQDRATDVISIECERPDDADLTEKEPCELGDIVLAPAYIMRQADDLNMDHQDECRLLLIHAMLHLLGYDHVVEEEAKVMEALEDRLLIEVGTTRHVGHVELTRHKDD